MLMDLHYYFYYYYCLFFLGGLLMLTSSNDKFTSFVGGNNDPSCESPIGRFSSHFIFMSGVVGCRCWIVFRCSRLIKRNAEKCGYCVNKTNYSLDHTAPRHRPSLYLRDYCRRILTISARPCCILRFFGFGALNTRYQPHPRTMGAKIRVQVWE